MMWAVRIGVIVLGAFLLLSAIAGGYLWRLGADTIARGEAAGWAIETSNEPLNVFEQTAAKALFAMTWNRSGFPCRTIANGLSGTQPGTTVSAQVALSMQMDTLPEGTLQASFARISAACQLEAHSDAALLRLWLSHFRISRDETLEAGSQRLLGKPLSQLDEAESAMMVALLESPRYWKQPEDWASRVEYIREQARQYVWVGDQLERGDTAKR